MLEIDTTSRQVTLFNKLRQVPIFTKLPEERLQWLIEQGKEIWRQPGEIHRLEGDPAEHVFVLLEGVVQITQKVDNQEILLATYDTKTLFGELPVLMGKAHFWASGRALTRCNIFELPNEAFWELLSSCTCVMTAVLRTMAQRVQAVQSLSQHREKMVALGTLAAGLAHELNNPASAASRATSNLRETFQVLQPLTLQLCQQQMSSIQQAFLSNLQCEALTRGAAKPTQLDPLTQSDREEEVANWLQAHDIADCWKLAPTLVGVGLHTDWLDKVCQQLPPSSLDSVLNWLVAMITGVGLLDEVEHCTGRISTLVQAVKDYSYMDQAPLQEVDVHEGLESTLTILGHKLKPGIVVNREYDQNLPRITAYGSELNQAWTNLIDNAIDAVDGEGQIWMRTSRQNNYLLVEIADNGPGIPAGVQSHIFEPFFTTKGVGKGTGLGLHIAYRIVVGQHQGDLRVTSRPGDTCFQVRLPLNLS